MITSSLNNLNVSIKLFQEFPSPLERS